MSPPENAQSSSSSAKPSNAFDLIQLTNIVSEIIADQNRQNKNNNDTDQKIEDRYLTNLTDLDKIPDIVKCIREFSGQPGEFSSWRKSVDRVLQIYESLKGTPKYYGILSVIRNKIVGNADIALESYNTPLNWEKISRCLTLHYADKRDLGTLEYQMMTLIQGNQTIPEFYQQVYQHLSLILNKLSCTGMGPESLDNLIQSYRDKALDTFIRGLKGDLPRLLSIREPSDLPQALHLCLKLQNVDYRIQYANNSSQNSHRRPPIPPPLIPKRNTQPFYPQLLHNPQNYANHKPVQSFNRPQFGFPTHQPNRPQFGFPTWQYPMTPRPHQNPQGHPFLPPKPLPKPTPMSVDGSIHSKQVNYTNRPQNAQFMKKRPYFNSPNQSHEYPRPNKYQRVFYNEQTYETPDFEQYQEQITEYDENYGQTLLEYTNSQNLPELTNEEDLPEQLDEQGVPEIVELDDINFLD